MLLYFADSRRTAGKGEVAHGDLRSGFAVYLNALVGRGLSASGERAAIVEYHNDGRCTCGAGMDEGIDAAVIKGGVATYRNGAFRNVRFAQATGHANGGSHREFGVEHGRGHDHAARVGRYKGILTEGIGFFAQCSKDFCEGTAGAVVFAKGFFAFPIFFRIARGWRESWEIVVECVLYVPAEEFAHAGEMSRAFAQDWRGNTGVVTNGFDGVFDIRIDFFNDEYFATRCEEVCDEFLRKGIQRTEFEDGESRCVCPFECVEEFGMRHATGDDAFLSIAIYAD